MKKILLILVAALTMLESCLGLSEDFFETSSYEETSFLDELKAVTVERVVDGDTFIYRENGEKIRVRCIGIDTPESVAPEETGKTNTEEGKQASEYVKEMIDGKTVYLEYDVEKYDQFDRELAYVYLEDGTMLEVILLSEGYAKTMTIEPDTKYADYFKELEAEAKEQKLGIWK